jgi:uncharacterized protein
MTAAANKQLMQTIFAGLAVGDARPFVNALAEDFVWTLTGTTPWSKTYRGKKAVRDELLKPRFAQFADQYINTATRFIAEDDLVVVECRGKVTTKSGQPYNNIYCWVCRLENGKLKELTEYMDTALVERVLADPA